MSTKWTFVRVVFTVTGHLRSAESALRLSVISHEIEDAF